MKKKWYKSWTIRWNVLFLVLGASLMLPEVQAITPDWAAKYTTALTAALNLWQRFFTHEGLE